MILTVYSLVMTLATLMMAVGCWIPGTALVIIGLGLSIWCWRQGRITWDGRERRAPNGHPGPFVERRVHPRR